MYKFNRIETKSKQIQRIKQANTLTALHLQIDLERMRFNILRLQVKTSEKCVLCLHEIMWADELLIRQTNDRRVENAVPLAHEKRKIKRANERDEETPERFIVCQKKKKYKKKTKNWQKYGLEFRVHLKRR